MKPKIIAAPACLIALGACQVAMGQTPPSCSDKQTQKLVIQEVRARIVPGEHYKAIDFGVYERHVKLVRPTPVAYNKDIQKYECTATLVVDATLGADPYGKSIMSNPQALYDAGTSIAELERFLEQGMSFSSSTHTYSVQINYSSIRIDGDHRVQVSRLHQIPSLLIGSLVAAYADKEGGSAKQKTDSPKAPSMISSEAIGATAFDLCMGKTDQLGGMHNTARLACIETEYKLQDQKLNTAYRQAIAGMTPDQKSKAVSAQRAWVKLRDADCDLEEALGAPLSPSLCLMGKTASRAMEIKELPHGAK
jgi:uncharacterized protein YecT (DUF1311 family)